MNHRIPCEIIQDLMPMYADGLTSETTDREIRSHLEECETCRETVSYTHLAWEQAQPFLNSWEIMERGFLFRTAERLKE